MTHAEVIEKKDYFRDITWHHLSNCISAFESKELLSAAVLASVFVESLLKDILNLLLKKDFNDSELYALIGVMRSTLNSGAAKLSPDSNEIRYYRSLLSRAEEIRLKRNRLVHDTGTENTSLDSDANDILSNLEQIIESYIYTGAAHEIIRQKLQQSIKSVTEPVKTDFPIFLSTITPHSFEQTDFIESFCKRLRSIGVEPVRCKMTDFDRRNPMEKARRTIERCNGIIVLGLERSHAYFYRDKEGSDKESEAVHRHYSSAWLQLETGMAIGMGKEVFVLCQKNLYGDGIFDRNWNSYSPVELDLPLDVNDPKIDELLLVLQEFMKNYAG